MDNTIAQLAYLVSAILFVSGIKKLSSPATARAGNVRASAAMLLAIVVTLLSNDILNWTTVALAVAGGGAIGGVLARRIAMTAMPELVAVFNGFGGGASAAVAAAEFVRAGGASGAGAAQLEPGIGVTIVLSTLIGAVTLSGSFIAFGKLQGFVTGRPVTFPVQKTFNGLLFLLTLVVGASLAHAGIGRRSRVRSRARRPGDRRPVLRRARGGGAGARRAPGPSDRRSRHARGRVAAQLVLGPRRGGDRIRARQP